MCLIISLTNSSIKKKETEIKKGNRGRAQILAKNVGNKRNLAITRTATTVFLENEREGKYYLTMAGWKSRKGLSQHLEE